MNFDDEWMLVVTKKVNSGRNSDWKTLDSLGK